MASAAQLSPADQGDDQQAGFSGQVSVGYVLVPVIARTNIGYADKLDIRDFNVTVDGEPISIESFDEGGTAPVTLLVLQDLSGSMANAGKLSLSRFAIERLLTGALPGDQYALASFANGHLAIDTPFTEDILEIQHSMNAWKPSGVTGLHDAVYGLPELSRTVQSARRAAIVITDGADNASEIEPKEARQKVREAELPVYVLGLSTGSPETLDQSGKKLHRYADVLNLLAHQSGGKYFWISDSNDVVRACGSIASDLRHQYVLGFSTGETGEPGYRQIEVTTGKKKVKLSFRRGYHGRAPKVAAAPSL
jgi:Ca-activated chloride channel family protein